MFHVLTLYLACQKKRLGVNQAVLSFLLALRPKDNITLTNQMVTCLFGMFKHIFVGVRQCSYQNAINMKSVSYSVLSQSGFIYFMRLI